MFILHYFLYLPSASHDKILLNLHLPMSYRQQLRLLYSFISAAVHLLAWDPSSSSMVYCMFWYRILFQAALLCTALTPHRRGACLPAGSVARLCLPAFLPGRRQSSGLLLGVWKSREIGLVEEREVPNDRTYECCQFWWFMFVAFG